MNEEIKGREFDWYAIDSEGNFGLFSTAGEGVVPDYVLNKVFIHDDISESIDSPNWGSSEIFLDYGKLGFYVFDWDATINQYIKKCEPLSEMEEILKLKILKLAKNNELVINFKSVYEVKITKNI